MGNFWHCMNFDSNRGVSSSLEARFSGGLWGILAKCFDDRKMLSVWKSLGILIVKPVNIVGLMITL